MTSDRKWVLFSLAATLGPFVLVVLSVFYLVYQQSVTRSVLRGWIVRHEAMHDRADADRGAILREVRGIAGRLGDCPPRDRKESE